MFDLNKIIQPHLADLKSYSSARNEFSGDAKIWLDANESPFANGVNRYPDPLQMELRDLVASQRNVDPNQIFIGNGSDEAIDLLIRCFCRPGKDSILICPPTYGMYSVSANINNILIIKVPLRADFKIDVDSILNAVNRNSPKIIFLCSPNNPTGSSIDTNDIIEMCENFSGLVVMDEAYIDYSNRESATHLLSQLPNLVVLQTLSKAYGMAGLRIGFAFANTQITALLNRVKPPYNINILSQQKALDLLSNLAQIKDQIEQVKQLREDLMAELSVLNAVQRVFPSDANFLLIAFQNADLVYRYLLERGIVARNRSGEISNCLRITIGTPAEQTTLIKVLQKLESQIKKT